MKQIIIFGLVVAGIIGADVAFGGSDSIVGAESNNFYGQESGVVTITEYGDFECPACAGFFPIVSQIKEEFQEQIRFEFKHFPLVQIHPNATAAHRASQAAANQGQFWEMHDLLYQRQGSWRSSGGVGHNGVPISNNNPTAIFEEYARELGLDMDQYIADANSSETLAIINADIDAGKQRGANSTPTFYIDGELIEDLNSIATVETMRQFIQDAIDAKNNETTETEATESTPEEASTEPEETTVE